KRRRRDSRLAANLFDQKRDLIDVAPAPFLARFERTDERVGRGMGVRGRVAIRRVVTAADVAAAQADPEMEPLAAGGEALHAAVHLGGQLVHSDLVEMGAGGGAHRTAAADFAARCECTNCTAIEPSPTAVAQRFVEPERTSPAAKMPGTLVSSRLVAPAASPVRMK